MVNVDRRSGSQDESTPAAEAVPPEGLAPAAPEAPAAPDHVAPATAKAVAADVAAGKPRGDIRLFAFPDYSSNNPYQTGLYSAVRKAGELSYGTIEEALAALSTETRPVVFHLHWPEPIFGGANDLHEFQGRADDFLAAVRLFRAGGGLFVWTIHNKLSHDRRLGDFEVVFLTELSALADVVHVHSAAAIEAVNAVYPVDPAKVIVVPHGSYVGYYPPAPPKDRARWLLSLPEDAFVFAMVGQLRPYKGIDLLLAAFEEVSARHPNAYLVIAGKPVSPFSPGSIKLLAEMNPKLRVLTGFLPPQDLARICAAADAIVLPYREILTSGSVLLAATYGKPVIVPSTPTLDFVAEEGIGLTYAAATPGGLRDAMLKALAAPADTVALGTQAQAFAERNAWGRHAEDFLDRLESALVPERATLRIDGRKRRVSVYRRTPATLGAIGVAVVNYLSIDDIEALIAKLPETVRGRDVRVYLFDNSAGARPNRNLIARADVYAHDGTNSGYAGGNNALLELMRQEGCEYGFILNPDVAVTSATFETLLDNARPDAVLAPAVINADGHVGYGGGVVFASAEGVVVNQLFEGQAVGVLPAEPYEVDVLNGCALFVPLALLPKIGHIPEDYFLYYEETHWCLSFKDKGVTCVVCPTARVAHNKRSKAGHFPALYYTYYLLRNRFVFASRWNEALGGGAYDADAIAAAIRRDFVAPWREKIARLNPGLMRVFERGVAAAIEDGCKGVTGRIDLPARLDQVDLKDAVACDGRIERFGGGAARGWIVEKDRDGRWVPGQLWVFRDGSPVRGIDVTEDRGDVQGAGFVRRSGFNVAASFAVADGEVHQFELRSRGDGRRVPFVRGIGGTPEDRPRAEQRPTEHKAAFGAIFGGRLEGWAYDAAHPGIATLVDVTIDFDLEFDPETGASIGTGTSITVRNVEANQYRPDLKKAGIGDGAHAFQIALPNEAFRYETIEATLRLAGREQVLAKRQITVINPDRGFRSDFTFEEFLRWSYVEERMPFGQLERIPAILEAIDFERTLRVSRAKDVPQTELVTVVMPVFNREKIVGEAIESVLAQTYGHFELIVVDDGSKDDSVAVVRAFDDPRIRLIELERNSGVSAARNAGLRAGTGPFVAYIDSDNVWGPDYLAVMLDAFRQQPEATSAYAGQEIWEYLPSLDRDEFRSVRMAPFNRARLERRNFIDLNVFMHRRESFERFGGFNESMRRLVDWELILRYTVERPPAFLPVTLGRYRIARADNQITVVEDHLANLALLRQPTPLTDLRAVKGAAAPPLAVFVHASGPGAFEAWKEANRALVADRRVFAAWPAGGGAEGIGPDGAVSAFESVPAALAACCDVLSENVSGGDALLLIGADYVLSGRWAEVYATASAEGRFDALTGRLYKGQRRPDGNTIFEDHMPLKIAASVIAWHFSPRMHGVVAAQLTADYMILPPSSVRRLQVCAALKSDLDEAVARFFGYSASGPVRGLYAPDLSAFAIADVPFRL
ncbi:glycosyltransferase [Methylorubrum salsuginis]|uniref:Glycosyltransferase, GT2 family n=1 Tax=Methylorubrum salsuginis TaxID=414703 RepID=A0A1I4BAN0_9HYPH|nr:glycosyltransferase [Methylorubrum salsuginis]SFK65824.1 Glycosyltransferase, GT2 family [Methylorubrum salsuginis]